MALHHDEAFDFDLLGGAHAVQGMSISTQPGRRINAPALGETNVSPDDHIFELEVIQNPVRARMCGFGDRDRRPLTPPLIVKCTVRDRQTGAILAPESSEANLVVHPSVQIPAQRRQQAAPNVVLGENTVITTAPQIDVGLTGYAPVDGEPSAYGSPTPPSTGVRLPSLRSIGGDPQSPVTAVYNAAAYHSPTQPSIPAIPPMSPARDTSGDAMAIRNLVGALQASANRMKDLNDQMGIFFAFVDLSVRTEGEFCLHLSLTDLHQSIGVGLPRSAILAEAYTDRFEVQTAKKFPGMLDPTPLSQKFAKQGLRIPTRQNKKADDGGGGVVDDLGIDDGYD